MSTGSDPRVASVTPREAWDLLERDSNAVLIDVRTQAEWTFVGVPDVTPLGHETVFVEWKSWPGMSPNTRFVEDVIEVLTAREATAAMFLCRSGVRSQSAAEAVLAGCLARSMDVGCINVATGFEGDKNADEHRGDVSGWKVEGLPWRQS